MEWMNSDGMIFACGFITGMNMLLVTQGYIKTYKERKSKTSKIGE